MQAAEPVSLIKPGAQDEQVRCVVAATAAEELPAGQEEQYAAPGLEEKVPEEQSEHAVTLTAPEFGLKRPASQRVHCGA